jgi:hypothetical protein
MSETLRLAHWLERDCATCQQRIDAAAELRRLHSLNAELVEALRCADALLSGANMDAKAVERKVAAALARVEASNGS